MHQRNRQQPGPLKGRTRAGILLRVTVIAALLALATAAIALSAPSHARGIRASGGTLRVGTYEPSGLDSANPLVGQSLSSNDLMTAIYPKLCQYSAKPPKIIPDFATSWHASSNGRRWTFKTHTGATWSDGSPLTAADVAFTFNTLIKYQSIGAAGIYSGAVVGMTSSKAPDPNSVIFNFKSAVSPRLVLDNLCFVPVIPQHIFSQHLGNNGKDLTTFSNTNPTVSGGVFTLAKFETGQVALMVRNDHFYGKKARVAELGLKDYSNVDGLISALKTGDIDLINAPVPEVVRGLKGAKGVVIRKKPGLRVTAMWFDTATTDAAAKSLLDPRIRQAIDLAVDRQQIVSVVKSNAARAAVSVIPQSTGIWANKQLKPVRDVSEANHLLDAAGYKRGADGVRVDPKTGKPLSYSLMVDTGTSSIDRIAAIVTQSVAQVGIRLVERKLDFSTAYSTALHHTNWDIYVTGSQYSIDPDQSLQQFTCGAVGTFSITHYCNKKYEQLYAAQHTELNAAKRVQLVHAADSLLVKQHPAVVLTVDDVVAPYRTGVKGVVLLPDGALSYFGNLTETLAYKG